MSVSLSATKLVLIEELPQNRVVSTYEFHLDNQCGGRISDMQDSIENVLFKTYNALQIHASTHVLDIYASALYIRTIDIKPTKDKREHGMLVIFCRDENIYCDLFDPATPTTELCSIAGGLAQLKQMAISTLRMKPSTSLN